MGRSEASLKDIKKANEVIIQVGEAVRDIDSQQEEIWGGRENKPSRKKIDVSQTRLRFLDKIKRFFFQKNK